MGILSRNGLIAIGIICLLLGAVVGACIATYLVVKAVAEVGSQFVDKQLIEDAIFRYRHHIANYLNITT